MRLLDTRTGRFVEKDPRKREFRYAILSHTWDANGEQTYKEMKKIQKRYANEVAQNASEGPDLSAIWEDGNLSPKILNACAVARKNGYRLIWIDSCCIDQTSSSELSEAINSMYTWYKEAHVCYAFLADVPPNEDPQEDNFAAAFRGSRWFTRGWTLQELLAPRNLIFLSEDWSSLGTKRELSDLVSAITDISAIVLSRGKSLSRFSVAQRLSWAARRETTRVEDRAYSLLGIFDINIPILYGEGGRAFQRLQEEILRRIPDQSIFAWGHVYLGPQIPRLDNLNPGPTQFQLQAYHSRKSFKFTALPSTSLLSPSPDNFADCQDIEAVPLDLLLYRYPDLPAPDYGFTPHVQNITLGRHPGIIWSFWGANTPAGTVLDISSESGRVCYVNSSALGIKFLSRAFIEIYSFDWNDNVSVNSRAQLVALSAEALTRSSALAEIDAVYMSHPNQSSMMSSDWDLLSSPHKDINLLLKRKPDSPGSYTVGLASVDKPATRTRLSLRWPDREHPTTHWLTISRSAKQDTGKVQDTIVIEYTHTLENGGRRLTIVQALISGTLLGRPIVPVNITWTDEPPWGWNVNGCMKQDCRWKERELVTLDNGEGSTAEMELSMEFMATNHYVIDARTEWYNESLRLEDSDSDLEEGYFTAEEDGQPEIT